jgi:hypothetical protein
MKIQIRPKKALFYKFDKKKGFDFFLCCMFAEDKVFTQLINPNYL